MIVAPLRRPWRHGVQPILDCFRRPRLHHEGRFDPYWLALLDAENVRTVILNRHEDRELLRSLYNSPHWVVDFADRRSVILVRAQ